MEALRRAGIEAADTFLVWVEAWPAADADIQARPCPRVPRMLSRLLAMPGPPSRCSDLFVSSRQLDSSVHTLHSMA